MPGAPHLPFHESEIRVRKIEVAVALERVRVDMAMATEPDIGP